MTNKSGLYTILSLEESGCSLEILYYKVDKNIKDLVKERDGCEIYLRRQDTSSISWRTRNIGDRDFFDTGEQVFLVDGIVIQVLYLKIGKVDENNLSKRFHRYLNHNQFRTYPTRVEIHLYGNGNEQSLENLTEILCSRLNGLKRDETVFIDI